MVRLGKGGKSQNDGFSLYQKCYRARHEGHPVLFKKVWEEILRVGLGWVRAHGSDKVLPLIGKTGTGTHSLHGKMSLWGVKEETK